MAINVADELNAATSKGKVASAKQVYLSDNDTTVEDKLSSLASDIANLQNGSDTTALASRVTTLESSVSTLKTSVAGKLDSDMLGANNGAASLDSEGLLNTDQLPEELTNDVLVFSGIITDKITLLSQSTNSYYKIAYYEIENCFVAVSSVFNPSYYSNWANARFYGSGAPRVPHEGKLYIDASTNTPYYWDGNKLNSLAASSADIEALQTKVEQMQDTITSMEEQIAAMEESITELKSAAGI